jgi:photosystem II stability/assembly factor-like uncharacterized protein
MPPKITPPITHRLSSITTTVAILLLFAGSPLTSVAQKPSDKPANKPASKLAAPVPVDSAPLRRHDWPDSAWRQIGPASFGGRVDDIEAVPDDPNIIFVGSASGGIFRSVNNGVTWDPVFDAAGTALSIGDIAIAPSDRNIIWAGTGEPNNRQTSTWGDGVYRSLDGGTTWQNMGLRETQSIGRVVIDPHDPNTVFVAAVGHLWGPNSQRGLYRTRDAGKTWQKVLGVDDNTGVIDVAMANDGRTLIAATYERRRRAWGFIGSGPGSGLWRSLDGGDTWERLTRGLPTGDMGRIGLDISKSNDNIVYAIIESRNGGVYRSTDRGATWTKQNPLNERAVYFSQIRVDPKNPDLVWVLATDMYKSIDGGKTFTSDSVALKVHADRHALWIDPNHTNHMLLGTDGGVFVTYDGSHRWDYVDNLPIGQIYDVSVDDRDPYWISAGVQDNGTFAFPSGTHSRGPFTDNDVMFIGYGDGFQVAADPTNPRIVYTNSQNGRGYVTDLETREERRITPVSPDRKERYRFNWNTAILLSPNDPHVYYYGANKLLKTTDRGTTWQVISPDLTRNQNGKKLSLGAGLPSRDSSLSRDDGVGAYGNITTISESPRAPGTIYVGTDDGNVQMTSDGGGHWTNLTSRFHIASPHWVSTVVASSHDAKTAYATFDGHADDDQHPYVFKTTDGGATWSSISSDLPAGGSVKTLTEDPRNPNLLFAGTEFGLYWSFDGGRHWSFPGGSLPRVMVYRILVNKKNNDLILATYGRSVIILDDIRALEEANPMQPTADVQLFPLRDATEVYQWRDNPLGARKFYAPNTPMGALINYQLRESRTDTASVVHLQILAPNGSVVRDLTGPATAGMHRVTWDLRSQLPFVPTPADSGFYGASRAPYVPAGSYTVKLTGRGQTLTQTVQVHTDPHALTTPEALLARDALEARIDSVVRVFAVQRKALVTLDSEFKHLNPLLERRQLSPALDSLRKNVAAHIGRLNQKFGDEYGATPMGELFDLLDGLGSSSATPTQDEQRTFDFASADVTDIITQLNQILTNDMPRLRAALSQPLASGVQ